MFIDQNALIVGIIGIRKNSPTNHLTSHRDVLQVLVAANREQVSTPLWAIIQIDRISLKGEP